MKPLRYVPCYAKTVFDALHFAHPRLNGLSVLSDAEWRQLIDFCHQMQLAIPFATRCHDHLPLWVANVFDRDMANNAERWKRIKLAYLESSDAFEAAGLEFVTLKGFTHAPGFVPDPRLRVQYDLDFLLPREQALAAFEVARGIGYEPLNGTDRHPVDHLPTLIRKTGWEWRGDFFDPEHPPALELHFRLWDAGIEGFTIPGVDDFWGRRQRRMLEDLEFTSLGIIDLPGYATVHALRHLLRGDSRPSHIYEIAYFLEHTSDPEFWHVWRSSHDQPLRRVQAICFAFAARWFGCRLPAMAQEEIERLPLPIRAWLATYIHAPIVNLFHPTKDELWLHLSLLDRGSSRLRILRRRLLPLQLPGPVDSVHLPDSAMNLRLRVRRAWRYWLFLFSRAWRHARVLLPTLWNGARWALGRNQ